MPQQKFYVVWKGRQTGIFETWDECKAQVHEFPQAKYKSFKTLSEAQEALDVGAASIERAESEERIKLIGHPIVESIAVDGAWNTATGDVEYRGIDMKTGKQEKKYLSKDLLKTEQITSFNTPVVFVEVDRRKAKASEFCVCLVQNPMPCRLLRQL